MTATNICRRRGCGARLDVGTNGVGALVVRCRSCDRNRAGLCRDCPAPLPNPKRMRCDPCRDQAARAANLKYERNRYADPTTRQLRLAQAAAYRARPDIRERRKLQAAEYRKLHPFDAFDRTVARERQRRLRQDPAFRKKESQRKRVYRQRQRLARTNTWHSPDHPVTMIAPHG